jgi:hypothetical protein
MNRHFLAVAGVAGSLLGVLGCTANADVAPSPATGCQPDSSVAGCDSPSNGFSCDTTDSPEQTDSSLVCSAGTPSGGLILYCCIQFTSSSCSADPTVQGCTGDSFGFSCTGTDTPDEADPSLNCSSATPAGGALLYCCTD